MNAVVQQSANPMAEVRSDLLKMEDQFAAALPVHLPVERFMRVVMTAVQNTPSLLKCDRRSLFNAAMRAAQDGLLPDGREGAIVEYKGQAQWMVMIGGIRKKARNSGEISTWDVHAVFENDAFEFELGDEPSIKHKPTLEDRGKLIAVYSIATLKGGEKSRDVMGIGEVEKIRKLSRAQNGPWANPTFYPEMAKKTVARRHSKVLPMSSDLDDIIRRDDALYDLKGHSGAPSIAQTFTPITNPLSDEVPQLEEQTGIAEEAPVDQSTGVIEGQDDDAAGDAADEADATALISEARSVSLEGRRKFDPWFNALTTDQAFILGPHMKSLMDAAKATDQHAPRTGGAA